MVMGCGSKRNQGGVVSGKVTYKGQPVNGATLRFYPVPGPGPDFSIPAGQDGTFRSSGLPAGEYKIVVEPNQVPPGGGREMPAIPKGMDPAKAEEMKQKFQQAYGQDVPTISFPNKYKNAASSDLKITVKEGDQPVNLDLKD